MNEEKRKSIVRTIVREAIERKELMAETTTKKHKERDAEYGRNFKLARLKEILRAHDHIADNLTVARGVHPQDDYAQGPISHQSFETAVKSVNKKLNKRKPQ